MSGVVLDAPGVPVQRSFFRLLFGVLAGAFVASVVVLCAALLLKGLGFSSRLDPWPLPFPVDGVWSFGADLVVAAAVVLNWAWWVRHFVAEAVHGRVSFGVVVLAVVVLGYAPFVVFTPSWLLVIVSLLAITWVIRRYAIGTSLPFSRPSWRVLLMLAVVGVAVFCSYGVYHPLKEGSDGASSSSGKTSDKGIEFENSGLVSMRIVGVKGGWVGPDTSDNSETAYKLPYTLRSHRTIGVGVAGPACVPRNVEVTFSILGITSTQRLTITPNRPGSPWFGGSAGAGCGS